MNFEHMCIRKSLSFNFFYAELSECLEILPLLICTELRAHKTVIYALYKTNDYSYMPKRA